MFDGFVAIVHYWFCDYCVLVKYHLRLQLNYHMTQTAVSSKDLW